MWSIKDKSNKVAIIGTSAVVLGAATATAVGVSNKKPKIYSRETFMCDHTEIYSGGIRKRLWTTSTDQSWLDMNPGWCVTFLSSESDFRKVIPDIYDEVNEKHPYLTYETRIQIYCVNILQLFGGVWVGPHITCEIPLDEWINTYVQTPSNISIVSSQNFHGADAIIAANQGCAMICVLKREINSYWRTKKKITKIDILFPRIRALCMTNEIFGRRWSHQLSLQTNECMEKVK